MATSDIGGRGMMTRKNMLMQYRIKVYTISVFKNMMEPYLKYCTNIYGNVNKNAIMGNAKIAYSIGIKYWLICSLLSIRSEIVAQMAGDCKREPVVVWAEMDEEMDIENSIRRL